MSILFIVNNPKDWPIEIPAVSVVPARRYLTDARYAEDRSLKVFNLCRSYRYQSAGYYVSLLATARGHRPMPSLATMQDLRSQTVVRLLSEELEALIAAALKPVQAHELVLNIYFGRNPDPRYDRLSAHLFNLFEAPLLRAEFVRSNGGWQLKHVRGIGASEMPAAEHDFVVEAATQHFAGKRKRVRRRAQPRYDLAILHDPSEVQPPSDPRALQRFERAATQIGLSTELITKDDVGRLAEFDALFIRETTAVNHHTFRIARRAEAEGLVVIDDSNSILKCTNKVYLAELLARYNIAAPRTLVVHGDNINDVAQTLGLPVVLKEPDSAFSKGVKKLESESELRAAVKEMLDQSELIIAQEFLPTEFDWRIGIIDRRPIYVCKYFMARRHWQIIRHHAGGRMTEGEAETMSVGEAPKDLVQTALKAANLIGDGFYGVDVKQVGNKFYVVEVNDNPSIEAGYEDQVLKNALYRDVMGVFLQRVEARKRGPSPV